MNLRVVSEGQHEVSLDLSIIRGPASEHGPSSLGDDEGPVGDVDIVCTPVHDREVVDLRGLGSEEGLADTAKACCIGKLRLAGTPQGLDNDLGDRIDGVVHEHLDARDLRSLLLLVHRH